MEQLFYTQYSGVRLKGQSSNWTITPLFLGGCFCTILRLRVTKLSNNRGYFEEKKIEHENSFFIRIEAV